MQGTGMSTCGYGYRSLFWDPSKTRTPKAGMVGSEVEFKPSYTHHQATHHLCHCWFRFDETVLPLHQSHRYSAPTPILCPTSLFQQGDKGESPIYLHFDIDGWWWWQWHFPSRQQGNGLKCCCPLLLCYSVMIAIVTPPIRPDGSYSYAHNHDTDNLGWSLLQLWSKTSWAVFLLSALVIFLFTTIFVDTAGPNPAARVFQWASQAKASLWTPSSYPAMTTLTDCSLTCPLPSFTHPTNGMGSEGSGWSYK